MDPSHSMKQLFRLFTAHSEAQPHYPPVTMDTEVADPFNDERKIQIVWNAGFELFKDELTTLGLSCRENLKGHFETCKDKFLLAEQHKNTKKAKSSAPKKPAHCGNGKAHGKKCGGYGSENQSGRDKFPGKCSH